MRRLVPGCLLMAWATFVQAAGPSSYYWYDGGVRRELWLESSQVADFSGQAANGKVVIKSAPSAVTVDSLDRSKNADAAGAASRVSPMFRDHANADTPTRALPGGVVVTLKQPLAVDDARKFLEARGLRPLRRIGDTTTMWLVEAPAGVGSLDLANRLQESGEFLSAAPNWWRPRVLK